MLTESQVDLIRQSAQRLADSDVSATNLFYTNLFRAAPAVRPLFPVDMFSQSEKLWSSIVAVVNHVDDLDSLRPTLLEMGRRHVKYGAEKAHYDVVRSVLIATIESYHNDDWTQNHQDAWTIALTFVCDTMVAGAYEAAA